MAQDWWFYRSYSFYHANLNTYIGFTKELVRIFDVKHFKTSFVEPKNSKPLHDLERSIFPTPRHIFVKGDKNMHDALPRARYPLLEESSSIDEDIEFPPSRENQDQGSLIDDEAFSNID